MEEKKEKASKNNYVMTDAKDIWEKIEQGKLQNIEYICENK